MKKTAKVRNFSALEVANLCGVVNQTAINWIKKKYLNAYMTPGGQYRVYGEDLVRFMKARGMRIPDELSRFDSKKGRNILFIDDDDRFALQILGEILEEYPRSTVEYAATGFEAGIKYASANRDLIFLNGDMTGLNPRFICEMIRRESEGSDKSIIVFSNSVDSSKKNAMLNAGADVYLAKPFDVGQISIYLE